MRLKLERRLDIPKWAGVAIPLVSVGIALLIMGIVIFSYMAGKPSYLRQAVWGAFNEYSSTLKRIPEEAWPRVEKLLKIGRTRGARSVVQSKLRSNTMSFAKSRLDEVFRGMEEAYNFVRDVAKENEREKLRELYEISSKLDDLVGVYSEIVDLASKLRSLEKVSDEYVSAVVSDASKVEWLIPDLGIKLREAAGEGAKSVEKIASELASIAKGTLAKALAEAAKELEEGGASDFWRKVRREALGYIEAFPEGMTELAALIEEMYVYGSLLPLKRAVEEQVNASLKMLSFLNTLSRIHSYDVASLKRDLESLKKAQQKGNRFLLESSIGSISMGLKRIAAKVERYLPELAAELRDTASKVPSMKFDEIEDYIVGLWDRIRSSTLAKIKGYMGKMVSEVEEYQRELGLVEGIESKVADAISMRADVFVEVIDGAMKDGVNTFKVVSARQYLGAIKSDFLRYLRDVAKYFPAKGGGTKLAFDYITYVFCMESLKEETSQKIMMSSDEAAKELAELISSDLKKEEFYKKAAGVLDVHRREVSGLLKDMVEKFNDLTNAFGRIGKVSFLAVGMAYKALFTWPFIADKGLPDTINYMTPLLFVGLGLILVFQMKLWNIGAEGQFYLGVMTALWLSLFVIRNPSPAHIPLILIMGGLAGAGWAAIAGTLKAFLNIDEIVSTLMLNYIAFHWMEHLVYGPWKAPTNFPETREIPKVLQLPTFGESRVHVGIILAVALSIVVYILMRKTWWGFDLRVIGDNQNAARYAGINIPRNVILAMAVSGFLAGLAGATQILGFEHKLYHGYAPGYGYTGIIIAWLARLDPWATILVSFLFGGFLVGGDQIQLVLKLPKAMVFAIEGVILFSLIASEVLFKYRIRVVRK